MRTSFKKIFEKNITLKIISLILAVFVWIYIMVVLNPPIDTTVRVPITFVNEAHLDNLGFSVVDKSAEITTVRVQGARNVIAQLSADDMLAIVDFTLIDSLDPNRAPHRLPITISVLVDGVTFVSSNPLTVDVTVDETITERREIQIITSGELSDGFAAGGIYTEPNFVYITGYSAIVNDISAAIVRVSLDGRTDDISEMSNIILVNNAGRELTLTQFTSEQLTTDITQAEVSAQIMQAKTVPITPNLSDYFMNGIENGTYTLSVEPETATIYGSSSVIGNIEQIATSLMQNFVSSGEGSRGTVTLVIPNGVSLRDGTSEVTITLLRVESADGPAEENVEENNG